jgi:hypothetical protein
VRCFNATAAPAPRPVEALARVWARPASAGLFRGRCAVATRRTDPARLAASGCDVLLAAAEVLGNGSAPAAPAPTPVPTTEVFVPRTAHLPVLDHALPRVRVWRAGAEWWRAATHVARVLARRVRAGARVQQRARMHAHADASSVPAARRLRAADALTWASCLARSWAAWAGHDGDGAGAGDGGAPVNASAPSATAEAFWARAVFSAHNLTADANADPAAAPPPSVPTGAWLPPSPLLLLDSAQRAATLGSLLVQVHVRLPAELDDDARALLRRAFPGHG